jgi:PAS domain S-box-containing protein
VPNRQNRPHDEQSRLRAVVNTAVDGVILIDSHGVVLMFNPACERLFGYASYEVVGRNVKMLMPEPYRSGHDNYLSNYRDTGERKIIGIGREVLGRKRHGETFPMYLSVGEAEENGEPVFVGIIRDLTERKAAEAAVHESERSFRRLVEGVTDYALIMLDRDGRVATWNVGAQRIKQYTAEEIIGRHFRLFFTEEDRAIDAPAAALDEARAASMSPKPGACARTAAVSGPTSLSIRFATNPASWSASSRSRATSPSASWPKPRS